MLVLDGFSWTFVGEADSYRRRPFPMKFLQQECPEYPVYAFTSELSKAFNDIDGIDTIVDLSEYANQINQRIRKSNKTKEIEKYTNRESLVTSTQEFIKNIIRDTFKKYNKTKLKPNNDDHILTLKVDGFREYLHGNYQLLQYERVRNCLRKKLPLKLILTEIKIDSRDKYFPPLFKMDKKITYPIIHVKEYKIRKQSEMLEAWYQKQKRLDIQRQENEHKASQINTSKGNSKR